MNEVILNGILKDYFEEKYEISSVNKENDGGFYTVFHCDINSVAGITEFISKYMEETN